MGAVEPHDESTALPRLPRRLADEAVVTGAALIPSAEAAAGCGPRRPHGRAVSVPFEARPLGISR